MSEISFETVDSALPESGFVRGDVVKMYKEGTELEYPCIVLSCKTIESFRVEALKGILGNKSLISTEEMYAVYVSMEGQVIQIGVLPNTRLKFVLGNSVFRVFDKRIHLNPTETVVGDMLFALCISSAT